MYYYYLHIKIKTVRKVIEQIIHPIKIDNLKN